VKARIIKKANDQIFENNNDRIKSFKTKMLSIVFELNKSQWCFVRKRRVVIDNKGVKGVGKIKSRIFSLTDSLEYRKRRKKRIIEISWIIKKKGHYS
jgi:hypothetical protein